MGFPDHVELQVLTMWIDHFRQFMLGLVFRSFMKWKHRHTHCFGTSPYMRIAGSYVFISLVLRRSAATVQWAAESGSNQAKSWPIGDVELKQRTQLPDALPFVTHVQISKDLARTFYNCEEKFTSILATVNDPVPSLKYLSWWSEYVPVTRVLDAIRSKKLSTLMHLEIRLMEEFDFEALARSIESGCLPFLNVLKLHGSFKGHGRVNRGQLALAQVMQAGCTPFLEELTLYRIAFNHDECQPYATAFSSGKLSSLIKFDFTGNYGLGDEGVKTLGLAIKSGKLNNLAHLDLNQCGFNDKGMIALADCFRAAPQSCVLNLRTLGLSNNLFTEVGLLSLADVLKNGHLNSLQALDVSYGCCFSEEGATALVSALAFNMHLNVEVRYHWEKFPDLERFKEQLLRRNSRCRAIFAGLVDWPKVPATFGKIYLCGNPEVGKTTLRQSLQRSSLKSLLTWERMPHVEERTRGIDVSQFSSKVKKRGEIPTTLLVWDMAGQRDYHLIHNAFLPDLGSVEGKATTFVVVCSSKSTVEESEQQLYYWLRFIASSCGKATQSRRHVMVVFNRIKGDPKVLRLAPKWTQALESLKGKFRDFLDIQTDPFIVDVRRQRSVKELKRRLLQHSINLLRDEKVPEICQFLEKNLRVWSAARRQFPVLDWTEFVTDVRKLERSSLPWREEDLQAATRYLNEAGLLIYIDKEAFSRRKLLVLDPNWFCRDIVGNMFLHQDMVDPTEHLFRMEVNRTTGSISISKFKEFFNSFSKEWTPSFVEDLITILLWLGLCYQGRAENVFIPSLITDRGRPGHFWGHGKAHGNSFEYGEDQWVMGFSVEHHKNELTLAPITLWHRFQVELAQTTKFNGHPDNDFVCGRYFMTFSADYMAVLIEVTANEGSPTFDNMNIFVKPLLAEDHFDGNHRKQCQVDLASELVEILLKLWIEVCPGVEYLHKVVWPWPASWSGLHVVAERNVDVEEVKKWVNEHSLGRKMQWMVGSSNTITEDQLLSSKHKLSLNKSVQRSLQIVNQVLEEAVALGIYPPDMLIEEGSGEALTLISDGMEGVSLPRSTTGRWVVNSVQRLQKLDKKVNEMNKKLDNLQDLSREILTNQKRLRQKLQDVGDIFLQDKERSCPRFVYLGEKDSGAWVPLKEALSPSRSFRLHFACEARYDDYGQHAVKGQHGLEVSHLKEWAKTIAPWVKVSLTVLYISAKIAANVAAPGLGLVLPNFGDWQQASSLSEGLAEATGFSREALNNHLVEGMGLDANDANWDPQELYGKSRVAMSELLHNMTPQAYEEKLGLRKVCLYYGDGSLHGIAWICNECFEEFRTSSISMTEL